MTEEADLFFEEDEQILDAEEIPTQPGVCSMCYGSKYKMREVNGVVGVLYTVTGEDSEGKPKKRLLACTACQGATTY